MSPLQLTAGAPYHRDDFVKVADGPHAGRWGIVTEAIDYRHLHVVGADNSMRLSFLIMVDLLTTRPGIGIMSHPPGPVPFEPHELQPLFSARGDWVRSGRVVPERFWSAARDGFGA